jgi:hypothetical protein
MRLDLLYRGRSGVIAPPGSGSILSFAPNLARQPVAFDEEIVDPLRFREAVSALHEIVMGDLRRPKKDRAAHRAYLAAQAQREQELRALAHDRAKLAELERLAGEGIPPGLEDDFRRQHARYWKARQKWAVELAASDPALFRSLVPCDPVVTVAPDVVMFECFAKDEASYGCLSVDRDGFRGAGGATAAALGTTNVDYSLALFEHFQTLRSYRPTRLLGAPSGVEVAVGGAADGSAPASLREEKIDLPASWLRGFGQLQAAMALPARHLELSVDVVYSILAYLKRHREQTGPRALRFVLTPGVAPRVVLEPWGVELTSRGRPYDGPVAEEIKVWGRRRLFALARTLPFAEKIEVRLLGSGLPSVWTARLGSMRLTLALSGWTANDWSRGSNLDLHFARFEARPDVADVLARHLAEVKRAPLAELQALPPLRLEAPDVVLGGLHQLARRGQLVYDFAAEVYRWRPILEVPLSEAMLGPEPEEVVAGRQLATAVKVIRDEALAPGRRLLVAVVGRDGPAGAKPGSGTDCEAVLDGDGAMSRARCGCSHFFRFRLRAGPCRHLLALRLHVLRTQVTPLPIAVVVSRGNSPAGGAPRRRPN